MVKQTNTKIQAKKVEIKASIATKATKSIVKAPKLVQKLDISKILIGETFSNSQYMKIIGIYPNYIELLTSLGTVTRI